MAFYQIGSRSVMFNSDDVVGLELRGAADPGKWALRIYLRCSEPIEIVSDDQSELSGIYEDIQELYPCGMVAVR